MKEAGTEVHIVWFHLYYKSRSDKLIQAKIILMINFIWTKRSQFSKACTQYAQHFPSKQNIKKGRAINLAMVKFFTLDYLQDQNTSHFPIFPTCFPKSPKIWDFGRLLSLRWVIQPCRRMQPLPPPVCSACLRQARFWSASPGTTKSIWEVTMMHYKQRPRKPQKNKAGTVMKGEISYRLLIFFHLSI